MKKLSIIFLGVFISCSTASLVDNWKNPDIVLFTANKVLVVGMTQNEKARIGYESSLQKEFTQRGIDAMRSKDLFDVEFTTAERSEEDLTIFENSLIDKGFDAILITKVIGIENIQKYKNQFDELDNYVGGFEDDYLSHQRIYYDPEYYENYTIYHAETSLYCICEGKERELIWRGSIDITDPVDLNNTIKDYVSLVVTAMTEQDLIFESED